MAGLNCEIKWETRLCEVNGELGYFHCWEHWSNVIDTSPLRGGHPGGQIGQVHGIIEFTDGVRRVDPSKIKFCDEENEPPCDECLGHPVNLHSHKPVCYEGTDE